MFYCNPCRRDKNWPETFAQSYGACEVCGHPGMCNNVPSSELPNRGETMKTMSAPKTIIEQTSLLGQKVKMNPDGIAWGRSVADEVGEIVSVYTDPDCDSLVYTVKLEDGVLIEARSSNFKVVGKDEPSGDEGLAQKLFDNLQGGAWRSMVADYRTWLEKQFPRYNREDRELLLGWIGTLFIMRRQLQHEIDNPPKGLWRGSKPPMTPELAREKLQRAIAAHLDSDRQTYRRHWERIDNYPAAEMKVEEVIKRTGWEMLPALI